MRRVVVCDTPSRRPPWLKKSPRRLQGGRLPEKCTARAAQRFPVREGGVSLPPPIDGSISLNIPKGGLVCSAMPSGERQDAHLFHVQPSGCPCAACAPRHLPACASPFLPTRPRHARTARGLLAWTADPGSLGEDMDGRPRIFRLARMLERTPTLRMRNAELPEAGARRKNAREEAASAQEGGGVSGGCQEQRCRGWGCCRHWEIGELQQQHPGQQRSWHATGTSRRDGGRGALSGGG